MKKYVLFAGVNGAGKTTLYQTNTGFMILPRVNVDEIVREFGNWNNPVDVVIAGRKAVELINQYFDNGISLWCVADNLRIGAALNTVRICQKVIEMGLY